MDTVMLGQYSQNAMSGVSLCNQIQFMLQMLVEGAGEGSVVLGAQYWGKNKLEPISHIIGSALRFGGGLAVLMFLIVLLAPEQLLGLLSNEPLVIAEGVRYFQIISFSYIIFTVTRILVASLRSVGIVKLGYIISFSTLCINVSGLIPGGSSPRPCPWPLSDWMRDRVFHQRGSLRRDLLYKCPSEFSSGWIFRRHFLPSMHGLRRVLPAAAHGPAQQRPEKFC